MCWHEAIAPSCGALCVGRHHVWRRLLWARAQVVRRAHGVGMCCRGRLGATAPPDLLQASSQLTQRLLRLAGLLLVLLHVVLLPLWRWMGGCGGAWIAGRCALECAIPPGRPVLPASLRPRCLALGLWLWADSPLLAGGCLAQR